MPDLHDAYAPHVPQRDRRGGPASPGLTALLGVTLGTIFGGFGLGVLISGTLPNVGHPTAFRIIVCGGGLLVAAGGYALAVRAALHARRLRRLGADILTADALDDLPPALRDLAGRVQAAAARVRSSQPFTEGWLPLADGELDRAEWTVLTELRALAALPPLPVSPGLEDLAAARGARISTLSERISEIEQLALGAQRLELTLRDQGKPAPPAVHTTELSQAVVAVSEMEDYIRGR
ncbi:hypothetical protein Lfu02_76790 [Longispora fulva]|uniref:Uncharacterized protein n=1 Tax=Longispora fulva TaxID=619741 RepID=A0A8J7GJ34_9ACTN|nr:hypothetical protein [Longispora fulva]MBG6138460.1 hypothetical protein [Longispora fulva]GIG63307.1 hypothetical protein Lfu02_76790 [Longispora fulva]